MVKQVGPVTSCLECNDGNWEELEGCVWWGVWLSVGGVGGGGGAVGVVETS